MVNTRRDAIRIISPSLGPVSKPRRSRSRQVIGGGRLTLVLGLGARADEAMLLADDETASVRAHADRTIAVNMRLRDASISAIEAAQVLADSCFCQSDEVAVLDRILSVIDELGDAIRALHDADSQVSIEPVPTTDNGESAGAALRKVFVPVGRGSIFRTAPSPTGVGKKSGGAAMRAEDADQFLADLIAGSEDESPSLTTVCRTATRLLHMSGSSVVLMGAGTFPSVASAYGVSVTVQDLEFTLGEGPASDSYAEGTPVMVDDIALFSSRWPQFTRAISDAGIRSVYALPLQLGAIKLGVLVLYRDKPAALEGVELSAALLVADLVTNQVLDMQAGAAAESLAWGLEVDDYRAVVHQATGMVSAQVDCSMGEALVRLRGRAFAEERPIDLVAAEVVTGDLRFDEP